MILTQARIRTLHPEANSELLKFVRLERAFVLFAFLIALFALIKIAALIFIRVIYFLANKKKDEQGNWKLNCGFLWFLDYRRYQRSRLFAIRKIKERDELAHNVSWDDETAQGDPTTASPEYALHKFDVGLWSHLATFAVSATAYFFAMKLWYQVSVFYHCNIIGIFMQGN